MIKHVLDRVLSNIRLEALRNLSFCAAIIIICSCSSSDIVSQPDMEEPVVPVVQAEQKVEGVDFFLPHIDLNNWKVTLPVGNPTEVEPPAILNYANDALLQEYMYNDSIDGSLVFYTLPGATTQNSSKSRTELREQMQPGSNSVNWTFADGGKLKGTLKMDEITKDSGGDYLSLIHI